MIVEYKVPEEGRGKTVLTVLKRELELSASLIRRLKREQGIIVNGKPVFTNYVLSPGETVSADVTAGEVPCDVVPETGDIDVIFESERFIAVNKPHGMIVHPSHSKYTGTLANFVAGYLIKKYGDGTCHAVNRLDRDTSGVVLFARNGHVKDRLSRALKETGVKEYTAIVCGRPETDKGTIDAPIKRLRDRELLRVVAEDGQRAVTHFELKGSHITNYGLISVLSLRLETGRTHQIRAHCFHIGCPIIGDRMYCTEESRRVSEQLDAETQLLHAGRLTFTDPFSGEDIALSAEPKRPEFQKFD
jgi:23S rRNA pseudouridine1911/1915/1917 synthase